LLAVLRTAALFKSSYPLRMFPERLYVNIASTNAVQEILRQR